MIAFFLSPLGKVVAGIALVALLFGGFKTWLHFHDKALLAGYVLRSEKISAEAQRDELQRQLNAGQIVIASYQEISRNATASEEQTASAAEVRINEYEKLLQSAGRRCNLDADDIRMLESR